MADSSHLSEKLSRSQILQDYERAFSEATGLPLTFEPRGRKRPGTRHGLRANPFCVRMAESEPGCRMCVDMQERLQTDSASGLTHSESCLAGLTDSTVPIRVGDRILGYLQTGQVALKPLTREGFLRVADWLKQGGVEADWDALESEYFQTRVISRQQYDAILRLLEVFSQHLGLAAEQIATQSSNAEPPMVQRARKIIDEHSAENLSLEKVARTVNASTFHFCKMFKRATGMTFTEYLSTVRVAKARKLLANPRLRVSEIAYEAGFSSLTHFNRMFRRLTGQSPTAYRTQTLPTLTG